MRSFQVRQNLPLPSLEDPASPTSELGTQEDRTEQEEKAVTKANFPLVPLFHAGFLLKV